MRQLRLAESALPYALRLAFTVGLATEIYRRLHYQSGYWIPMTALLVLKPDLIDTVSRAIARTLGTMCGAMTPRRKDVQGSDVREACGCSAFFSVSSTS